MTECHLNFSAASVLNLRDETVRVFSDGVPERDYPEGCQLAVLCERKRNYSDAEIKGRRSEAERLRGHKDPRSEDLPRT
jgi:hypothetical protein